MSDGPRLIYFGTNGCEATLDADNFRWDAMDARERALAVALVRFSLIRAIEAGVTFGATT